jgi:hypothetical protein
MKMTFRLLVFITLFFNSEIIFAQDRIALVIGNSKYQELGVLNNTINDAKAIENSLKKIGYKTTTIFDASESVARRGIKKFAAESESALVTVVYYAGHGAQINGENYLLPIDLETPKRESDIQLSAIKVDDIVNSIKSKIKVVFLDACRDNPVLAKNLAKGRGGYRGGLGPTLNNYSDANSGGIFIAYATDAGNIALDGEGQKNSPFAESLVKYIAEPISIDDMFSKVTKEVRAKTNNTQKPYKYASLDDIFCLTLSCSTQAQENKNILSDSDKSIKEKSWVAFNTGGNKAEEIWMIDVNSIRQNKNRIWADIKILYVKDFENYKANTFLVNGTVIECSTQKSSVYRVLKYNEKNEIIEDKVFGFPEITPIEFDYSKQGTLGYSIIELLCNELKYTKISKSKLSNNNEWQRYYSLDSGDELFVNLNSAVITDMFIQVPIGLKFKNPVQLSNSKLYTGFETYTDSPIIAYSASLQRFNCETAEYWSYVDQLYDNNDELIAYTLFQDFLQIKGKVESNSPFGQILKSICKK